MAKYSSPTVERIGDRGGYGSFVHQADVAVVTGGILLEIVAVAHQVLAVLDIVDAYKEPSNK